MSRPSMRAALPSTLVSLCQGSRGWFRFAKISHDEQTFCCKRQKENCPCLRASGQGIALILCPHRPLVEGDGAPTSADGMTRFIGRDNFTVKNNFTDGEYGGHRSVDSCTWPKSVANQRQPQCLQLRHKRTHFAHSEFF